MWWRTTEESFDIIIHAFCNLYIQDMQFVWNECYRVLKKGGIMIATMDNGINCLFKNQSKEPLIVENKLPLNSLENKNVNKPYNGYDMDQIYIFSHTLERLLCDAAGALEGVPEKHRYRHGADTARNGRDGACDLGAALEICVANETEPLRLRGIGNPVHAHVDHDGAFFEHVAGKRVWPPCRDDDDVCVAGEVPDVRRSRVAEGYGRIRLLAGKKRGDGLADDVASADHDGVLAANVHPRELY